MNHQEYKYHLTRTNRYATVQQKTVEEEAVTSGARE